MEEKIISSFNKLFDCLSSKPLKSLEDLTDCKTLFAIGLEMDKEVFEPIRDSISGENDLGIRIAELTNISEGFLTILKSPKFIPTKKYKQEIELIDVIGLATNEHQKIYYLSLLVIICIFYCKEKNKFITKIDKLLSEQEQSSIYDVIGDYIELTNDESKNINKNNNNNDNNMNKKIEDLQNELLKEKEKVNNLKNNELKLSEKNNILSDIDLRYNLLNKELNEYKIKNANLEKKLELYSNLKETNDSLQKNLENKEKNIKELKSLLDQKNNLLKEKELALNKEVELNLKLQNKIDDLNNMLSEKNNNVINIEEDNKSVNELNKKIEILENKLEESEKKYTLQFNISEKLKIQNNILEGKIKKTGKVDVKDGGKYEELLKVNEMMQHNLEEELKNKNIIKKEKEDMKNHYEKEFELMASAIYNLGFSFWTLKYENEENLKQNKNWLVQERMKQYNGDW